MPKHTWGDAATRIATLAAFGLGVFLITYSERQWVPLPSSAYLIWGALWGGMLLPLVMWEFDGRWRVRFYALFALCLVIAYALPISRCEPIVRDLARVRPGMMHAQVMEIMRPYILVHNLGYHLCLRHDTVDSAHNADSANIEFSSEGRVIYTRFSGD